MGGPRDGTLSRYLDRRFFRVSLRIGTKFGGVDASAMAGERSFIVRFWRRLPVACLRRGDAARGDGVMPSAIGRPPVRVVVVMLSLLSSSVVMTRCASMAGDGKDDKRRNGHANTFAGKAPKCLGLFNSARIVAS